MTFGPSMLCYMLRPTSGNVIPAKDKTTFLKHSLRFIQFLSRTRPFQCGGGFGRPIEGDNKWNKYRYIVLNTGDCINLLSVTVYRYTVNIYQIDTVASGANRLELHDDWDDYIHQIAFGIRTCQHTSTKATPFYLTYGREAVLPIQLDIPTALSTNVDTTLTEEDFQELVNDRVASFQRYLTSTRRQQKRLQRPRKNKNKKQISTSFRPGDQVLLKNKKRLNRKGDNSCCCVYLSTGMHSIQFKCKADQPYR